jgi:signal transduction histidine kinase
MAWKEWLQPPRYLVVAFFGITLISTTTLAWLSLRLVGQDRALATQRVQEDRENVAGLAAAELQKNLSQVEERLTGLANLPDDEVSQRAAEYSLDLPSDSVLLIFTPTRVEAHPAAHLTYYPMLPSQPEAPSEVFAAADTIEFRDKDPGRAVSVLGEPSRSSNPLIRAEALLRIARNLRTAGRWKDAVTAYEQLANVQNVEVPPGIPADLAARGALAALFDEHHDDAHLAREAETLYTNLHNGHWRLTRPVYELYVDQTRRWLNAETVQLPETGTLALAETASELWQEWNTKGPRGLTSRSLSWTEDGPVLRIQRSSAARMVALEAGSQFVESRWLSQVRSIAQSHGATIALTAIDGRPFIGAVDARLAGRYAMRLGPNTGLPWTLYVTSNDDAIKNRVFTLRSQIVLAGLMAIALLVLGGSYLIGRAVFRELAVARLQSDFVSAVSHEFRTPLTAMRQLTELLAQGRVATDDVRRQYYQVLESETNRLHRLVEGLLKFGRIEAHALRYQFETIDMAAFLRALVEEFSHEASKHGFHIELDVSRPVPQANADREALSCVIWNLLDNAVKYSPECHTVWVDLTEQNRDLAIRVRDQGVGIPPEEQRRIFQKFVRGNAAKAMAVQGTGIGLAVARQIVQRHGGEILLESAPGKGSRFTVRLPVQG